LITKIRCRKKNKKVAKKETTFSKKQSNFLKKVAYFLKNEGQKVTYFQGVLGVALHCNEL